uniref:Glomulin, FKBP associated protein a n=1 Tax=Oryzias melastigma TaxID=30732 RepID=A0A3B3DNA0_ORYME
MALEKFSDVVQLCQALPESSYTAEHHDAFTAAGRACIQEGHCTNVLSILLDEKNQEIVRCMGWTLLPPLIQLLLKKEDKNLPQWLAIFTHLLESCRPKELLIGLLEQLEHSDPHTTAESLHLLLKPLQKVLLRLGSRKASSLGMTLSSVLDQLAKLPLPLTKEEDSDEFSLCCVELIDFVRPFFQEARQSLSSETGRSCGLEDELRAELLKFCMKTLSHLLLEVQLRDPDELTVSPLRTFATEILDGLTAVGEHLHSLVFQPVLKRKQVPGFLEEEVRYPKASLAGVAHLVFVHHLAADSFPSVFSPVFCLRCNMEHIFLLLSSAEDPKLQKGLELYEKSLVRLEDSCLPADLLQIKTFLTVPQRTKGLKVFQLSIDKFDTEAKYRLFQYMLSTSNHSGVEGYIIKNIRTQIHVALQPGNGNVWFEGVHLLPLLRKVFSLPDGPETDLLQYLDRLMEALNLLRFLVIRDKVTENQTGVWTELYKIEDSFMKPLRVGLNMSRAHYEQELRSCSERRRNKEEPVLSVSVSSEKLPQMTPDSQIQVGLTHTSTPVRSCGLILCCPPGSALGPPHLRHDGERAGSDRRTHRAEGGSVSGSSSSSSSCAVYFSNVNKGFHRFYNKYLNLNL